MLDDRKPKDIFINTLFEISSKNTAHFIIISDGTKMLGETTDKLLKVLKRSHKNVIISYLIRSELSEQEIQTLRKKSSIKSNSWYDLIIQSGGHVYDISLKKINLEN